MGERYLSDKVQMEMVICVPGKPEPNPTIRQALIDMLKKLLGMED